MRYIFIFAIISLSSLLLPIHSDATTHGSVEGIVRDVQTGQVLPGANVWVEGTSIGAATDLKGHFRILHVPPGSYTLMISYIGYKKKSESIKIESEKTTKIDINLDLDVIELENVVITAQAEGQIAAINQQLASNTIVNVVSKDRIKELPDANAAESVGRLSGVSVVRDAGEGQKVVIRGLSPKYNSITINNVRIPATDLEDRSVDLSMIPSAILSDIELAKALTPDKDADAIGGTVNFTYREAPANLHYSLNVYSGYSGLKPGFGNYKGGGSISSRFLGNKLGVLLAGHSERTDRSSDVFDAQYEILGGQQIEERKLDINRLILTDRIETRDRFGANLIMDYKIPNGKLLLTNLWSKLKRDEIKRQIDYEIGTGNCLHHNIGKREINANIISNLFQGEHRFSFMQIDWLLAHSRSATKHPYNHIVAFEEATAFNQPVERTKGPEPIIQAAKNNLDNTYLYSTSFQTEESIERDLTSRLDMKVPFFLGRKINGFLKFGGKYQSKIRERDTNQLGRRYTLYGFEGDPRDVIKAYPDVNFDLTSSGYIKYSNFLDPSFNPGTFLDGDYELGPVPILEKTMDLWNVLGKTYWFDIYSSLGDYNTEEHIYAGYLMAELNLGKRLMVLPGIRYERTRTYSKSHSGTSGAFGFDPEDKRDMEYLIKNAEKLLDDTTASRSYENWFPQFHIRYKFTDWLDLRLARTECISRPDYRYIIPTFRVYSGFIDRGNPNLKPTITVNYDAFLSLYTNRVGLFTVGGFYKELGNLVYFSTRKITDTEKDNVADIYNHFTLQEPVYNDYKTIVKGLELEWQTNFHYLPRPFNGIVLNINYTHIFSETKFPRTIEKTLTTPPFKTFEIDTFRTGRMPDQPDHIVNMTLGYDISGFSGRISLFYQKESLTRLGIHPEEDSITEDYLRWDMSLKQRILKSFSLFVNVNNISNRPDQSSLAGSPFPTLKEYYGWTGQGGLSYVF